MIRLQKAGLAAGLAASLMLTAATAQAKMIKFTMAMTGTTEVPPTNTAATGTAEVRLDT